jgi:23S rRNA (adenine2503-C2)-methyltransferase
MQKILTELSLAELEQWFSESGEAKFRARQLFNWIYARKTADFASMTDLALSFREKLRQSARVFAMNLQEKNISAQSGSIKYLFFANDQAPVESVYIPESSRRTLCISSQAGCALMCKFCATGQMGLQRNLSTAEMVSQVLWASQDIEKDLTNIVFMGMGEPFHNYEAVLKACYLLNEQSGLAIGHRHIVISTVGIVPAIYRYADEGHKFRLAISLHAAVQDKRAQLIPIAKKYQLVDLMKAVIYYAKKSRSRPTIEYILLAGVNDSEQDALALRSLLQDLPCKINLIPYNPTVSTFKKPSADQVLRFANWLYPLSAPVSVRWSKGDDIEAACGQLAGKWRNTPR